MNNSSWMPGAACPQLKPARIPLALAGLGMLSIWPAFAADVVGTNPANASLRAPVDTAVTATLDGIASGVSALTFPVRSSQTALGTSINASTVGNDAIVDPVEDFHPGERVMATVTAGVKSGGVGVSPRVWSFRTQVAWGTGVLSLSSANSLGGLYSQGVVLGDVDGNGSLDAFVANGDLYGIVADGNPNRVWLNDGSGVFVNSGQSLGTSESHDLALGDLDGDGDLDAFVANGEQYYDLSARNFPRVGQPNQVWINDGSGVFTGSGQTLGNSFSADGALGDLEGDGDIDVFVANVDDDHRIWLNDGSGIFTNASQSLGIGSAGGVALGDVDGDGDLDAFVANLDTTDNGLGAGNRIFRNLGNGVFSDTGQSLGSSNSYDVALGDLDGDGDLDAFVANGGYASFVEYNVVWINDGSGIFTGSGQTLAGTYSDSYAATLGDLDGDGDLDAFVVNGYGPNRLWLNDGGGRFSDSGLCIDSGFGLESCFSDYSDQGHDAALGDVDADGDLDVLVAHGDFIAYFRGYTVANRVWLNTPPDMGDAPFPLPTTVDQNGARHGVVAGAPTLGTNIDGENDGQPNSDATGDDSSGSPNDEDGLAAAGPVRPGALSASVNVDVQNAAGRLDAWVDFNADGSFDGAGEQIFTNLTLSTGVHGLTFPAPADAATGGTFARFRISGAGGLAPRGSAIDGEVEDHLLTVLTLTQGFANFAQGGSLGLGSATSRDVALGDLDGDGALDAFVANASPNRVWINDGGGAFSQSSANSLGNGASQGVALGDLDRDGDLDAFLVNYGEGNRVWLNNGGGIFVDANQGLGSGSSRDAALGDVDGDGDLDAFVANEGAGEGNRVWLNDGSGVFIDGGQSLGLGYSVRVALGDVNDDGFLDAVVANSGEGNRVWLNDGSGAFTDSGNDLGSFDSTGVALGDVDGDGDLDAVIANRSQGNRVWSNDGSGVFSDTGQSLGSHGSTGVALGDMDADGDLDAVVSNYGQGNRLWRNDGSGNFVDSLNSLGTGNSEGVALGDLDGDGDLDGFVVNASPNRVWLNQLEADGGDGFPDTGDNCPGVANPKQKDMDNDGEGNQCDDDTDGDGEPNASDPDDDNDGILDGLNDEVTGDYPRDGWDPDRDDDGIIDGLDREPDLASNMCTGPDAEVSATVSSPYTCAASGSIIVKNVTTVEGAPTPGALELISPVVDFEGGFEVKGDGKLSVISKDPTAQIPNPP